MSYTVTITKSATKATKRNGDWTVIEKRPWTEAELAETRVYGGTNEFLKETPLKEVRGYAPALYCEETTQTEVLKQTVEDIDLAAVIRAINKL